MSLCIYKINLWNLDNQIQVFNIIDLKPETFEDLSEAITVIQFHLFLDNQFIFSTSKGLIKLLVISGIEACVITHPCYLKIKMPASTKNSSPRSSPLSQMWPSVITDNKFSQESYWVSVFYINMSNKPVETVNIFKPLKSKLCELYENESIFDKFSISSSPWSNYFLTKLLNKNFHI